MEKLAQFVYGIVMRLTFDELHKLKNFIEENELEVIFDKVSSNKIILVEKPFFPSGTDDDNQQE